MKEMGFASTTLTYNDIMCQYANIGQYEKVPEVLAELKENKVSPDNYSYGLCINSYGARSDILKEAETQPHTYAVAANFYIKAGLTDKAIDALKKAEIRVDKKDAYLEKGLLEKAEEMLESGRGKDSSPNTWGLFAARYQEKGEMHKVFSSMKAGLSHYVDNKGWKPNKQVIILTEIVENCNPSDEVKEDEGMKNILSRIQRET